MIANHGRIEKYNHIIEGRNSRLDSIQARILSVKLKYLDKWLNAKRIIAAEYKSLLKDRSDLKIPYCKTNCVHSFHLFVIQTDKRDQLKDFLNLNGIQTGIHYPISLPNLKAYSYLNQSSKTPIANNISSKVLSLPIGENLALNQIKYISEKIHNFLDKKI